VLGVRGCVRDCSRAAQGRGEKRDEIGYGVWRQKIWEVASKGSGLGEVCSALVAEVTVG